MTPDASGKFKGISVPSIPWSEKGRGMSPRFQITARGPQAWEWADVEVRLGRATIVIDDDEDKALALTRIQTEELARWLQTQLEAYPDA